MTALLTARDVCQRLREAALGVLMFNRSETPADTGLVAVDIEAGACCWILRVGACITVNSAAARMAANGNSTAVTAPTR